MDTPQKAKFVFKPVYIIYPLIAVAGFFMAKLVLDSFTQDAEGKMKQAIPRPVCITAPAPSVKPREAKEALAPSVAVPEPSAALTLPEVRHSSSAFSLNGIYFDEESPYALVNNQIVKVGDTVSGAKVVRITSNEVDLETNGETIELLLR